MNDDKPRRKRRDRTNAVALHMTKGERDALKAVLDPRGLRVSTALAKVARELIGAGPVLLDDEMAEVVEAIRQVQGIAINLNQIARAVNSARGNHISIDTGFLRNVRDQVAATLDALRDIEERQRTRWVPIIESQIGGDDGRA
jgi:uncharacterized protein YpuA (DUF1002 family)